MIAMRLTEKAVIKPVVVKKAKKDQNIQLVGQLHRLVENEAEENRGARNPRKEKRDKT